ncbi:MAG: amidohydrolase family protein [Desulfarculaceae bacterium]|nr:amidohydrolase family protein [Desulfarculaceae bacterium]
MLKSGRIAALGGEALAAGAPRREMPGLWLSAAPIDAHVHLQMRSGLQAALDACNWAGLAAVRDLGHRAAQQTPRRNDQAPLVVAAGVGLGAVGEAAYWLAEPVAGAEGFARAVDERAAQGCGVIKLFATGLLDIENVGQVCHPQALSAEEVRAAVEHAHAAGLKVSVHANGEAAVRQAIEQGADCIEHGYFLGRDTLARMAELGVEWSPTLAPIEGHAVDPAGRNTPAQRAAWSEIGALQKEQMRQAVELGVRLVLGSDAGSYGVPHAEGAFLEMRAWLEAGLAPELVYDASTRRAAKALGLAGELGGIFPGARAWLLGTRQDPRGDPLQLARPLWRSF